MTVCGEFQDLRADKKKKKSTVPQDGSHKELYLDSTLTGDSRSRTTTQKRKRAREPPEERGAGEGPHVSW